MLRPGGRAVVSAHAPRDVPEGRPGALHRPRSGEKVQPGSVAHTIGEFVMAAVRAGFAIEGVDERAPDADFAARLPRAEKYVDWPMLVVLRLRAYERLEDSASRPTRSAKASMIARVLAPTRPSPTGRPSIATTGSTSRETLVRKASATRGSSSTARRPAARPAPAPPRPRARASA